jgi:hypothetical protein
MEIVPVDFDEACTFVAQHHRHHVPPQGHKFSLAVADAEKIVGVAIVGRPVSRHGWKTSWPGWMPWTASRRSRRKNWRSEMTAEEVITLVKNYGDLRSRWTDAVKSRTSTFDERYAIHRQSEAALQCIRDALAEFMLTMMRETPC